MPLPVSLTSSMTTGRVRPVKRAVPVRTRKVIVPSRSMLSAAFRIKLINTCSIWCGSTRTQTSGTDSRFNRMEAFSNWDTEQRLHFGEQTVSGDDDELWFGGAGKLQEFLHDALQALDFVANDQRVLLFR